MTTPIPEPGADVDISVDPDAVDDTGSQLGAAVAEAPLTTDPEAQLDDSPVAPENS